MLLLASMLAASAEAKAVAKLIAFDGEVQILRAADGQINPASQGMALQNGDIARVSLGTAEIEFTGGDFMMVYPNSEVSIKEEKGENVSISRKIGITFGKIWVDKKSGKTVGTEFVTRTAVAGVRGSQIMVSVDKVTGLAEFLVGKGSLEVTVVVKGKRYTVTVKPGMKTTVTPGQPPAEPSAFKPGTVPSSRTEAREEAAKDLKAAIKAAVKESLSKEKKSKESKEKAPAAGEELGETISQGLSETISEEISEAIGEEISENIIEEIIKKEITDATVNVEIILQ